MHRVPAATPMWYQFLQTIPQRVVASLYKSPAHGWKPIGQITLVTTATAGVVSVASGFIDPMNDFAPPRTTRDILRACSALVVPGLLEELMWRAALLPTPPATGISCLTFLLRDSLVPRGWTRSAATVLAMHVCFHPLFAATAYPRGKQVFFDVRFLLLASIVLGGSTLSYLVSGGSVWAAAVTHAVPVIVWRDFFGGETKLRGGGG